LWTDSQKLLILWNPTALMYADYQQDDKVNLLPLAKFFHNNMPHSITQMFLTLYAAQ
jgi:hypothetical protein